MRATDRKGNRCRICGKPILIITQSPYRKYLVDEKVVFIEADPDGEEFVRFEGGKVKGKEIPGNSDQMGEPVYRPHKCGKGARKG